MSITRPTTTRPRRRKLMVVAFVLVALALTVTWRMTSLAGLPDIGDPFDVAAFADVRVADDRNAFTLYKQSLARLVNGRDESTFNYSWTTASQAEKQWLDRNREALNLWRAGTDRPEALYLSPRSMRFDSNLDVLQQLRTLCRMATLEGSRLEAEGALAGASGWYLAQLRCSRHCGLKSGLIGRLIGVATQNNAAKRINAWAVNPKVDAAMLRHALEQVLAIDAMSATDSDTVKCEYLTCMNSIDDPKLMTPGMLEARDSKPWISPGFQRAVDSARIIVRREPERSRRVVRLIVANWLSSCDLPLARQPPTVATRREMIKGDPRQEFLSGIYAIDSPQLPADDLTSWFESTSYARMWLPATQAAKNAFGRERTVQGGMVITLATELYRREHGKGPATTEELVGPYLKVLPEGFATGIAPTRP